MGSKSVYNCIRALVMANRYAEKRHADAAEAGEQVKKGTPIRIGFVPTFGRNKSNQWMRLQVVPLGARPTPGPPEKAVKPMRTSTRTEIKRLGDAILNQWLQCCGGRTN